jgi:RHH-type proline utilization regulon transcriptional repressor/proline dehydrogenase/delta 1-pyrroline-5-carboxylate dehydrogenase
VQEDIALPFTEMLFGAMEELVLGDPWLLATDIGPVIDAEAEEGIRAHVEQARREGRLLRQLSRPRAGHFIAPAVIRVKGIADLSREIFGPVLHIATFRSEDLPKVVQAINATGYGLTFGLHTRIDNRVQEVCEALRVGNIYVNRNQIGAVVGSQPFGGEGLSGTGPKAGGPDYLARFAANPAVALADKALPSATPAKPEAIRQALVAAGTPGTGEEVNLPGPTGESNRLSLRARVPLLCLGPGPAAAADQARAVEALGGHAVEVAGHLPPEQLTTLQGFSGAIWWGTPDLARAYVQTLAARQGPILPLITGQPDRAHATEARHVCVDTTASGGNAALLAEAGNT